MSTQGRLEGITSLSDSRISKLKPASIKSCDEALSVASITFVYTGAWKTLEKKSSGTYDVGAGHCNDRGSLSNEGWAES